MCKYILERHGFQNYILFFLTMMWQAHPDVARGGLADGFMLPRLLHCDSHERCNLVRDVDVVVQVAELFGANAHCTHRHEASCVAVGGPTESGFAVEEFEYSLHEIVV